MSVPFLGEIKIVPFNFAPRGWAFCDGQQMAINQNIALFSIMGTIYGGNGVNFFNLPDLQERVPLHTGQGPGLTSRAIGESSGQKTVALTVDQVGHSHTLAAVSAPATATGPAGNYLAQASSRIGNTYHNATNLAPMSATSVELGSNQSHENRPPFLALNYIVALVGIYPSRN